MSKLLSPWAIVPCLILFIATYFVMAQAAMQADDFDRELNSIEITLSLTPFIPIIWFTLILAAWVFRKSKAILKQ